MRPHLIIPAMLLVHAAGSGAAIAQDEQADPDVQRPRAAAAPIEPTPPSTSTPRPTGITSGHDWIDSLSASIQQDTPNTRLSEGTFIVSRKGRLVNAPNNLLIFVPDPETRAAGEGPMLLLPCATLDRLEQVWTDQLVELTGEVFIAHARAHLLIVDAKVLPAAMTPDVEQSLEESDPDSNEDTLQTDLEPELETPPSLDEDPQVDELLRELGAAYEPPPHAARFESETNSLRAPELDELQDEPPELAKGIHEGTILVRRRCRMDRRVDGSWTIIFDNDDPESVDSIELTLLPCLLMQRMESIAIRRGPETELIVSGRVYVHDSRGYLLPTFAQVQVNAQLDPVQ